MAQLDRLGVATALSAYSLRRTRNAPPSMRLVSQGGLGCPTETTTDDDASCRFPHEVSRTRCKMLTLLGDVHAAMRRAETWLWETALAQDSVDSRANRIRRRPTIRRRLAHSRTRAVHRLNTYLAKGGVPNPCDA